MAEEEKGAAMVGGCIMREERRAPIGREMGRVRISTVKGLVQAIVVAE